jgi:hypothetical protein
MNELATFHGNAAALVTGGGPNIRAMVKHFMEPYSAAEPFADVVEIVRKNSTPARRSNNEGRSAAVAIRNAVAGNLDAVVKARDHLSVVMLPADEENIRAVIAAMMMAFPVQPNETSSHLIDVLTMEILEDGPSLAAIAATARQMWRTLPSPPAISTFLEAAEKHQAKLREVRKQLCDVLEASMWSDDLLEPDKPFVWDEADDDYIPIHGS